MGNWWDPPKLSGNLTKGDFAVNNWQPFEYVRDRLSGTAVPNPGQWSGFDTNFVTDPSDPRTAADWAPFNALVRRSTQDLAVEGGKAADEIKMKQSIHAGGTGSRTADLYRGLNDAAIRTAQLQNATSMKLQDQWWRENIDRANAFNFAKDYANKLKKQKYDEEVKAYNENQKQRAALTEGLHSTGVGLSAAALAGYYSGWSPTAMSAAYQGGSGLAHNLSTTGLDPRGNYDQIGSGAPSTPYYDPSMINKSKKPTLYDQV
jgi:hypothetical protein